MERNLQDLNKKIFFYSKKNIALINDILNKFPKKIFDIYFKPEYNLLYQNSDRKSSCFYFQNKEKIFFYPFLLQKIDSEKNYYDITTPYGYGGPISNSADKNFLIEAEDCLNERLLKLNVIAELIKFHPLIYNHILLKDIYRGKISKVCKTVSLNISKIAEEDLLNKIYSYSNKKSIKKAERNECQIMISRNKDVWNKFISLYELNLKKNKASKKYFFSKKYYKIIKELMGENYYIFSCKFNEEIVSSMIILYNDYYAHCHLIGSNNLARKLSANNLLHHEVIKWCKSKNINKLHFGGGVSNDENDAVYKFKKSFSNETNDFYVGERIINYEKYNELCKRMINMNEQNNKLFKYRKEL